MEADTGDRRGILWHCPSTQSLGKPKPTWTWMDTTCNTMGAFTGILGAKGRLRKSETHLWMGQGTYWQGIQWKRNPGNQCLLYLGFTDKICHQEYQAPETCGKVWVKNLPLVEEDQLRPHLNKLGAHKSMECKGMLPSVPRELAGWWHLKATLN